MNEFTRLSNEETRLNMRASRHHNCGTAEAASRFGVQAPSALNVDWLFYFSP